MIVVLKTPSLAERVAAAGGAVATSAASARGRDRRSRRSRLLVTRLALQGVIVHPDYSFTRVLDGFSTLVESERGPDHRARPGRRSASIPVRVAYPAAFSARDARARRLRAGSGDRPTAALSGIDGRGVTIALLDTGVDATQSRTCGDGC